MFKYLAVPMGLVLCIAGAFMMGRYYQWQKNVDRMMDYASSASKYRVEKRDAVENYQKCILYKDHYRDSLIIANRKLVRYNSEEEVLEGFPMVAYDRVTGVTVAMGDGE